MTNDLKIGDFTVRNSLMSSACYIYRWRQNAGCEYLTKNRKIESIGAGGIEHFYYGNKGAAVSALRAHYKRNNMETPTVQREKA